MKLQQMKGKELKKNRINGAKGPVEGFWEKAKLTT